MAVKMTKSVLLKKISGEDKGSVMLEYLILSLGFFVVLAFSAHFFLPNSSAYGNLGDAFIDHYNLVLDIISMPYP